MELKIMSVKNEEKGKVKMPIQFQETVREDIIRKAVHVMHNNARQPYGTDPEAGQRHSAKISRRRRDYRGAYGFGISRVPRKIHTRRGTRMNWVAALSPGVVGGRQSHPPKVEKIWDKKMNKKENKLAIRSALSATLDQKLVLEHGYLIPKNYPFIIEDAVETLDKTKDVKAMLTSLGFTGEMDRAVVKNVRPGRGTMRGRRYKKKTSLLFVVSKNCKLSKAALNVPGVEIVSVDKINPEVLAPGSIPGRATLYSKAAVEKIEKQKMFV